MSEEILEEVNAITPPNICKNCKHFLPLDSSDGYVETVTKKFGHCLIDPINYSMKNIRDTCKRFTMGE